MDVGPDRNELYPDHFDPPSKNRVDTLITHGAEELIDKA